MGDFKPRNSEGRFNGRSSTRSNMSNNGGFRGGARYDRRDNNRSRDGPTQMHNVVCSKCGVRCQVPFKPTGAKPVYCSDCFRQNDNQSQSSNFSPRREVQSSPQSNGIQSNHSESNSKQFDVINAKLDKILLVLSELELDIDLDDEDDEVEEESSKDDVSLDV